MSFGNKKYYNSLNRIKEEAIKMNIFDDIFIFNENDLLNFNEFNILSDNHKFILNNKRGYGYWIWKSFLVKKVLEKIENDDIIIYADAGCTLNYNGIKRLHEYINIVKNSQYGILSFELTCLEKQYTKMDLFNYLNMNNNENLNKYQLVGGIFILKKNENIIKLINEWYITSNIYNLINDSNSILKNDISFIEHRHDQSIFSLLRKKYGTEIIKDETYFTNFKNSNAINFPIWATRRLN